MNSYETSESFRGAGERLRGEASEHTRDRFKVFLSLLIAFATLVGALISWRASVAFETAGGADSDGIAAVRNLNRTHVDAVETSYRNRARYIEFREDQVRVEVLQKERAKPDKTDAERAQLDQRIAVAANVADSRRALLPAGGYYNVADPDHYDLQREIGERTETNRQDLDTNGDDDFALADKMRSRATSLVFSIVMIAGCLVLLTMAYESRNRVRYVWCAPALVIFVAAVANFARLELFT